MMGGMGGKGHPFMTSTLVLFFFYPLPNFSFQKQLIMLIFSAFWRRPPLPLYVKKSYLHAPLGVHHVHVAVGRAMDRSSFFPFLRRSLIRSHGLYQDCLSFGACAYDVRISRGRVSPK